jgi:hypothetical protein
MLSRVNVVRRLSLPRVLAALALGGCSGVVPSHDAGSDGGDGGCRPPSDFPPDASRSDYDSVCSCAPNPFFHCFEEGGPRCGSWSCFPRETADGGYQAGADGGVVCLC